MARVHHSDQHYGRSVRRVLLGVLLVFLFGIFLLWRIDNPRVERFRSALIDRVVPSFSWALVPAAKTARMFGDFESYANIYAQNQELRRELQRMKGWREAALQLEQKNAKLLELNDVRISPKLSYISGVVLTDSGSPFRQSALINVGRRDGVIDGWATMDGLGLAGRISGVGENTSRVILLTDSSSRVPVTILPSGQKAIMAGINTPFPLIEFLETPAEINPGDQIFSSGDGRVFPPDILVGHIIQSRSKRYLVQLSVDYQRLEFLRVLRSVPREKIGVSDTMIGAPTPATPAAKPLIPAIGGHDG